MDLFNLATFLVPRHWVPVMATTPSPGRPNVPTATAGAELSAGCPPSWWRALCCLLIKLIWCLVGHAHSSLCCSSYLLVQCSCILITWHLCAITRCLIKPQSLPHTLLSTETLRTPTHGLHSLCSSVSAPWPLGLVEPGSLSWTGFSFCSAQQFRLFSFWVGLFQLPFS